MFNSFLTKFWIGCRFIIFGVGGFFLMFRMWIAFLDRLPGPVWQLLLMLFGAVAGATLMLYGVGEWGKWLYLLVFLSIPASLLLLMMPSFPHDKLKAASVPAIAAVTSYVFVKRYYSPRHSRSSHS